MSAMPVIPMKVTGADAGDDDDDSDDDEDGYDGDDSDAAGEVDNGDAGGEGDCTRFPFKQLGPQPLPPLGRGGHML